MILLFFSFCTSCNTISAAIQVEEEFCIEPVADYSVPIQNFFEDNEKKDVSPGYPWELESRLPIDRNTECSNERYYIGLKNITNYEDYSEIWASVIYYPDRDDWTKTENYYIIYNSRSKEWQKISASIPGKLNWVSNLYFSRSGKIWGLNEFSLSKYTDSMLSYYDKDENLFIIDERGKLFTDLCSDSGKEVENKMFFDNSDNLWILVDYDGIYKYELESGKLSREADMPNGSTYGAKILEDGNIYFVMYVGDYDGEDEYDNERGLIFIFSPKTKEISMIKVPEEALSGGDNAPSDFLFDESGRFWISNLVYKDTDEQWYEILYSPLFLTDQFVEERTDRKYNEVRLILKSSTSDGRLWYIEPMTGTYFTDPDEQKWCWVTTEVSTVLEDGQGYLWMIADDSLYKRPLDED